MNGYYPFKLVKRYRKHCINVIILFKTVNINLFTVDGEFVMNLRHYLLS